MKQHPDFTPELILADMGRGEVSKVGGQATPEEIAEAKEGLLQALEDQQNKILTLCIGCENTVPLIKSKCCVCGGFVCPECVRVEEEGVCNHERPFLEEEE